VGFDIELVLGKKLSGLSHSSLDLERPIEPSKARIRERRGLWK
jgi:hypothetical protein